MLRTQTFRHQFRLWEICKGLKTIRSLLSALNVLTALSGAVIWDKEYLVDFLKLGLFLIHKKNLLSPAESYKTNR